MTVLCFPSLYCCFFFNDTATTDIYTYVHTLSLHDALPIYAFALPLPYQVALEFGERTHDREHQVGHRGILAREGQAFLHELDPDASFGGHSVDGTPDNAKEEQPANNYATRISSGRLSSLRPEIGRASCRERVCQSV